MCIRDRLIAELLAGIDYREAEGADLVAIMAIVPGAGAICCALIGIGLFVAERADTRALPRV